MIESRWLRIPRPALLAQVHPLAAVLWACAPIAIEEVIAAVAAGEMDARVWDTVKDELQGPAGRAFHIRRIAKFVTEGLGDPHAHPITIGIDASGAPPVRLYNGNHRLAAAVILKPETIDARVSYFDPQHVTEFLPGSIVIYPEG